MRCVEAFTKRIRFIYNALAEHGALDHMLWQVLQLATIPLSDSVPHGRSVIVNLPSHVQRITLVYAGERI